MKRLDFSPAGLGAVRFHISPVNQVGGLLRLAMSGDWHPTLGRLARAARPLLDRDDLALLRELTPPNGVGAMPIIALRPEAGANNWDDELAAIESLDAEVIRQDIADSGRRGPAIARSLDSGRVGHDVAAALRLFWKLAVAEHWSGLEAGLRAEVARCAELISSGGIGQGFGELHHRVHWVADDQAACVILDKNIDGVHLVGSEGLVLQPNAFLTDEPLVTVAARTEGVSYPCRLPEQRERTPNNPMAKLIGVTRARVLDALAAPLTTTALSAELALAPSTVSTHLKVLHSAGLVTRRRDGQRVLYSRT